MKNVTAGKMILVRKIIATGLKICLLLWHSFRIKWDYVCQTYISVDKFLVHANSNVYCIITPVVFVFIIIGCSIPYCNFDFFKSSTLNLRVGIMSYFISYCQVHLTYGRQSISFCWFSDHMKIAILSMYLAFFISSSQMCYTFSDQKTLFTSSSMVNEEERKHAHTFK